MKRKQIKEIELYLPNEEIEKLNKRYEYLYKQVKSAEDISEAQVARENEILLNKYNFEIIELSALYEADYWKRQAEIKAKNAEQTPWRRCWLWRLLFQPVTNRAQDIIEKQAELDAEELFAPMEKELKTRSDKLYGKKRHWWQRKKRRVEPGTAEAKTPSEPSTAAHSESDAAHQNGSEAREAAQMQLEEAIKQADETPSAEAFEQPEPPAPPTRKARSTKQTGG